MAQSIQKVENNPKIEATKTQRKQRIMLLKKSFKWNLGALISSMLFVITWKLTRWIRR